MHLVRPLGHPPRPHALEHPSKALLAPQLDHALPRLSNLALARECARRGLGRGRERLPRGEGTGCTPGCTPGCRLLLVGRAEVELSSLGRLHLSPGHPPRLPLRRAALQLTHCLVESAADLSIPAIHRRSRRGGCGGRGRRPVRGLQTASPSCLQAAHPHAPPSAAPPALAHRTHRPPGRRWRRRRLGRSAARRCLHA